MVGTIRQAGRQTPSPIGRNWVFAVSFVAGELGRGLDNEIEYVIGVLADV